MPDLRRVLMAIAAATVAMSSSCRPSRSPESDASDSAQPSARTDSAVTPAAGGSASADSVSLRTDKRTYRAGEQVTLTLENRSASTYAFNPCTRSVEREAGGAWTPVPEPDRVCTMEAWILDPRGTRTGTTELPARLAPGRYRAVLRLTVESSPGAPPAGPPAPALNVASAAFEVR